MCSYTIGGSIEKRLTDVGMNEVVAMLLASGIHVEMELDVEK